jgi:hypothetical protein
VGKSLCTNAAGGPVNHRLMTDCTEAEPSFMPHTRPVSYYRICRLSRSLNFVVKIYFFGFFGDFSI